MFILGLDQMLYKYACKIYYRCLILSLSCVLPIFFRKIALQ